MATACTFTFDEDKQLVQLVGSYANEGSRVVWSDVTCRMGPTRHTMTGLQQWLRTLKKSWGKDVTRFPKCFFTSVRKPRGRPPAVTRRLRDKVANSSPSTCSTQPRTKDVDSRGHSRVKAKRPLPSRDASPLIDIAGCVNGPESGTDTSVCHAEGVAESQYAGDSYTGVDQGISGLDDSTEFRICGGNAISARSLSPRPKPLMNVEKIVTAIFEDVPRGIVIQNGNHPHQSAGVLMQAGVSSLLAEFGDIDKHDIFLDIGSGVGNIVNQVALGTGVKEAIGVELREDVHRVGLTMIDKNLHDRCVRRLTRLVHGDIAQIEFSSTMPYSDATIIFWNNLTCG